MKSVFALSAVSAVAIGGSLVKVTAHRTPLVAPEAILDLNATSLTTYLPAAASPMQSVEPRFGQRATQLDGARRKGGNFGLAMNGNPFVQGSGTSAKMGSICLDQGTYEINDVDLALPAKGIPWVIGRTYNARQLHGGSAYDSSGYQGKNWFQSSNPEVKLYSAVNTSTEDAGDVLCLIFGADRFVEFKRIGANKTEFRGVNGAAGVVKHNKDAGSEPGTYVYTDQNGNEEYFFDFDGNAGSAQGQLWKLIDPAGNTCFFGDATTASTAVSSGYSSGKPSVAYDATNRRYSYSYDGAGRLSSVVCDILASGTWTSSPVTATVGQVDYAYYTADADTFGDAGDLKTVTITTPMTDSGISLTQKKYYRYYDFDYGHASYNSSTNPGYPHLIQLIVGFEGCRKYDYAGDGTFDDDFLGETTSNLEPYAEAYFEYNSDRQISSCFVNGACGCSGGATTGVHTFTYETSANYSNDTSGYDEDEWYSRTIVARPDGGYETQYFDEVFQPLSHVLTNGAPSSPSALWATYVDRNSKGVVVEVDTPANVTAYTHTNASVSFTRSSSAGLVWTYTLVGSSNTTEGFASDRYFKEAGTSGTAYLDRSWTYTYASYQVNGSETKSQVARPVVASDREYASQITSGTSGSNLWSYSYDWHDVTGRKQIALKAAATTQPAVTTGHNGSNSSNVTRKYWNEDGTLGFEKSALGYITYHEYTNGRQTRLIEDANTALTGGGQDFDGISIPTNFSSNGSGSELRRISTFTYDNQGRPDTTTANSYTPKRYYSLLKDRRLVTLGFTNKVSSTYYGPVSYSVTNHARKSEVSGVIGLGSNATSSALSGLIDETDDDPITAVDVGTVKRMTTNHYDSSGTELQESRRYFAIPASEPGTDATHYDPTVYGYDDLGRQRRVKNFDGTIHYSIYDLRGHVTESWIGTNDHDAYFRAVIRPAPATW